MSYKRTVEIREKQSRAMRGKPSPNKGKTASEETRERMRQAKRRPPENKTCPHCGTDWVAHIQRERNQKYCSQRCYWETRKGIPFFDATKIDRSYMKMEEYRKTKRKETTPEYRQYRNRVSNLTEKTYEEFYDIINPNNHPRTLCGVPGGYQLDHIQSVKECFDLGIPPESCARLENLQMLPWRENLMKEK